jgi:hypothetical protein
VLESYGARYIACQAYVIALNGRHKPLTSPRKNQFNELFSLAACFWSETVCTSSMPLALRRLYCNHCLSSSGGTAIQRVSDTSIPGAPDGLCEKSRKPQSQPYDGAAPSSGPSNFERLKIYRFLVPVCVLLAIALGEQVLDHNASSPVSTNACAPLTKGGFR